MSTITRIGLLASSKRVVMLCLLELYVVFIFNWARFLELFIKTAYFLNVTY